jgi:hypothetical protein
MGTDRHSSALYQKVLICKIPYVVGKPSRPGSIPTLHYCLHWFPYEIIRCNKLKRSRVSTRALYRNCKYRAPFPRVPSMSADLKPVSYSVCRRPFTKHGPSQVWISLRAATDVLRLLGHACSTECIQRLPKAEDVCVAAPHQGGLEVMQPTSRT